MMMENKDQTVGVLLAALSGFYKSLTIATITWGTVWETVFFTALGAAVGFIVTGLLKFVKSKIKNWK